ncbi:DIS3-like exonuclease 2 [Cydia fagiglandana]|uniref:DIS3-like exonuclease 2 n=1 Tax=Cydia fagiglandana TaxID=1458189 RepID=UPI002FEE628B
MASSDHSADLQAEMKTPPASSSCATVSPQLETVVTQSGNIQELCKLTKDLALQQSTVKPIQEQNVPDTSSKPLFTNARQNNNEVLKMLSQVADKVTENTTPKTTKKKNAKKKKERLKKLQIAQQNVTPQQSQTAPPSNASVQELFTRQIAPMYQASPSHYLENLSYHPHFQYMYQQQPHNAASVPSSPLAQLPIFNAHHPDMRQVDPNTPRYLQNVMQHPLLNKSYSLDSYQQHQQQQLQRQSVGNITPNSSSRHTPKSDNKHRRRTKSKENNQNSDKRFGLYMTLSDVEMGLKSKQLIEGVVRINPKQFTHAYVSSKDRDEQDILIEGIKDRNRALEGDIVVVEIITDSSSDEADIENKKNDAVDEMNESGDLLLDDVSKNADKDGNDTQTSFEDVNEDDEDAKNNTDLTPKLDKKQKRGRVVYLKEKVHNRTCIGVLKLMPDKNRQKALFVPRDHRIPRLNIPFTSWPDNFYKEAKSFENTLFLAKIMDWFDSRFANGKIIKNIGQSGDMVTETTAILAQNDLDVTPFGQKYSHLYPRLDYVIPEDEIKLREDCRKLCIFSIDPSNCRDIDDAVSCRKLDNGNYEIGVHISDVSHFLTEGTELDEKVAEKATTIYLVEKAYHMLPDELCMLCSLFPGVDKLAFSVFWEITDNAEVLSHRFAKTVIHSCSQLAYEHAQAILEGNEDESDFPEIYNGFQYKDVRDTIKILGKIGAKFRRGRFENGALRIDQPKVAFHLHPFNGLPKSFWIYESKESHQLIEEFMLLANMTVAERIYKDHPRLAFLRCHPPPSGYMMKQLAKALKPMGIDLEIDSAGSLQRSILPYVGAENEDRGRAMVLSMLCAKPMARAKYFCADGVDDDDFHHYALNVPLYTHFTSPIRRYADIMVHRLLTASLKNSGSPEWEVDKVRMIAAQCNKQKYNAKKAGEMSTELYTLKYIEMHSPMVTEGVVVEVREKYIDVIIVAMGLNRRVYFNPDFPGDFKCVKNDAGAKLSRMEVLWHNGKDAPPDAPHIKQVIEVFSIVKIEMHKGNEMVKVETRLVKPEVSVEN